MMKETPAKTLASVLVAVASFVATAATWTDGEGIDWTYTMQSDGTLMLGESGRRAISDIVAGDVTIPATINGRAVTAIGERAFDSCEKLEGVTIPESVKRIGYGAFYYCHRLKRLSLPKTLTDIGEMAFSQCYSLTNSHGFVIVNDILFNYYGENGEVTVSSSVRRVCSNAFHSRMNVTQIEFLPGPTNIGDCAFGECLNLKSVKIPSSVRDLGKELFYHCVKLECVTLPDDIREIKKKTFSQCFSLERIKLPSKLEVIGERVFVSCSALKSLTVPSGVTTIGDYAFGGCTSLETIRFMGDAPSMGEDVFGQASSSVKIILPRSLPRWAYVYETLRGLTVVASQADGGPYKETVNGVEWSFTVTNGMATVESGKFCTPAVSSSMAGDLAVPKHLGFCEVEKIGTWAFYCCDKLTSVSLPDTVLSIGISAFDGCKSLLTVKFPPALERLEMYAFYNCTSLKRVVFAAEVKRIDTYAFCGCTSLESVVFNGNEPSVGNYAFYSCPSRCKALIPSGSMWTVAGGGAWNGLTIHSFTPEKNAAYIDNLPTHTFFTPDATVKVYFMSRSSLTEQKAAEMGANVKYLPGDIDQDPSCFKAKATVNAAEGAIVVTPELDLEALAFAHTSKAVAEQMAAAESDAVTITLDSAKPGFWYGVTAASDLTALNASSSVDAAGRATSRGVSLTLPKPKGGTAFFKVRVSDREIAVKQQ